MKGARTALSIIGMVLFVVISFQSCIVGIGDTILENGETGGAGGIVLSFLMLFASIVGVCVRKSKTGSFVAGVIYLLSALAGYVTTGSFSDLKIWATFSLIFGLVFILTSIFQKQKTLD